MNREEWLTELGVRYCLPLIGQHVPLPVLQFRVSCGFPKGRGGRGAVRIGECHPPVSSSDNTVEIFISPTIDEPVLVSATLLHELVHFAVGNQCGHKGEFRRVAKAVGLEGKMTSTVASAALELTIKGWVAAMPHPYPHKKLSPTLEERPGSRLLKMTCNCGFTVRISRKWSDSISSYFSCPSCHDGQVILQE